MKMLKFPTPEIEKYEILYNPVTHKVDIPLIPDDAFAAVSILAIFMDMLLEEGTLDITDLDTTVEGVKLAQQD